ncbi:hypothetical protein [Rhodococcus koreensis]
MTMSVYENYESGPGQWEANQFEEESTYENTYESWETSQGEEESLGAEINEVFGEQTEGPFSEVQETELANELLEITSEDELEEFLGKLVSGVGKFAKSSVGKALGGALKGIAKTVLPMAAGALGNFIVPGAGASSARNSARWPPNSSRWNWRRWVRKKDSSRSPEALYGLQGPPPHRRRVHREGRHRKPWRGRR